MNGLPRPGRSQGDSFQHLAGQLPQPDLSQRDGQTDLRAESHHFIDRRPVALFEHKLDQRAESHFFAMGESAGLRGRGESIVNGVGRGQTR